MEIAVFIQDWHSLELFKQNNKDKIACWRQKGYRSSDKVSSTPFPTLLLSLCQFNDKQLDKKQPIIYLHDRNINKINGIIHIFIKISLMLAIVLLILFFS